MEGWLLLHMFQHDKEYDNFCCVFKWPNNAIADIKFEVLHCLETYIFLKGGDVTQTLYVAQQ